MAVKTSIVRSWTLATFLGWLFGIILILLISISLDTIGIEGVQFFTAICMGLSIGFMQWRVLKKRKGISKKWIWQTSIGLAVPFIVMDIISFTTDFLPQGFSLFIAIGLSGIVVGFLQYRILKNYSTKAKSWIWVSFVGWILAALTLKSMEYTNLITENNMGGFFINIIAILSGGLILGYFTGLFLKKILN